MPSNFGIDYSTQVSICNVPNKNKKSEPIPHREEVRISLFWWGKVDSNHRSDKQQIYSLSPLATREFPHIHITSSRGLGYHIIFSQNVKKNLRSFQRNLSRQRRTFSDILTGKKWLTSLRENATMSWKLEEMEAPRGCGFSKAR